MLNQFQKQQADIMFYTGVICQDKQSISKANEWLKQQKDIPYLPKQDMFAYYCPMCNSILEVNCKCKQCGQLIEWGKDAKPKLINGNI